jgi:ribosomal protein L1
MKGCSTQQRKIAAHIVEDAAKELALTTSTVSGASLLPDGLMPVPNPATRSSVDSLIEAMKHGRAAARE